MTRVQGILISNSVGDFCVTVDDRGLPDLLILRKSGEWASLKSSRDAAPVARELLQGLGVEFGGYNHTQQLLKALVVLGLNRVTEMFFSAARW
jgi:hypothetical protein